MKHHTDRMKRIAAAALAIVLTASGAAGCAKKEDILLEK